MHPYKCYLYSITAATATLPAHPLVFGPRSARHLPRPVDLPSFMRNSWETRKTKEWQWKTNHEWRCISMYLLFKKNVIWSFKVEDVISDFEMLVLINEAGGRGTPIDFIQYFQLVPVGVVNFLHLKSCSISERTGDRCWPCGDHLRKMEKDPPENQHLGKSKMKWLND